MFRSIFEKVKRIFKIKKEYTVITDMPSNRAVQEFAKKYCPEKSDIDVHVHGCLLEGNNLVTITFKTNEEPVLVYSDLIDTFWTDYRLAIRRKLIFVYEKENEEVES